MRDSSSGGDATGERYDVRVPVRDQGFGRFLAITGNNVDNSAGKFMERDFRQEQCRKRRMLRRLDDHGIAAHQRRCNFPGHQKQRVVPRHDADDQAVRFLHHKVHLVALHRWNDAAGFVAANFGVVIKTRRDPLNFVHVFNQRLATLLRQKRSETFAVFAHVARGSLGHGLLARICVHCPLTAALPALPYGREGAHGMWPRDEISRR